MKKAKDEAEKDDIALKLERAWEDLEIKRKLEKEKEEELEWKWQFKIA